MLKCVFTEHSWIKEASLSLFNRPPYSVVNSCHAVLPPARFLSVIISPSSRLLSLLTVMVRIPQGPGLI